MSKDLSKIIEACQYLLNDYSEAQPCKEYLDKRLNKNSQELFQFGYFPTIDLSDVYTTSYAFDISNKCFSQRSLGIDDI